MLSHPLLWLYAFFQFLIFVYLVNRVSFHPRRVIPEALWVILGTLVLFALQASLGLGLARTWDFSLASWPALPAFWKLFTGGSALWVSFMALEHLVWYGLRRQKVDARLVWQRFPNHPPRFRVPLGFLESLYVDNQVYDLEVAQYDLYLPGWPAAFSGLSIVQVSDIHFGKYIHRDYVKMVFDEARKLKTDLYALTGDFISHPKDIEPMRGLLKGFRAPLGAYAVLGNHDHWAGAGAMRKVLERDGIRVLQNEAVFFKRKGRTLALMGVDDYWEGKKDEGPILKARGDAKILLAHQPDHFFLARRAGAHLQVSGHCHGGQICFPLVGPLIVPTVQGRKFAAGFFREKGSTLFIHRGIGGFPPLRTHCRPQVVKLVLKPA